MKRISCSIILVIVSLFFINDKIHAEKYKCEYEDDKGITTGWWIFTDTTKKFQYTVDTENRTISSDNVYNYVPNEGSNGSGKIDAIADILADSSKDESYYVDIFEKNDWKCVDRVYMCKYIQGVLTLYTVLFDDTLRNTIENSDLYFYNDNGKNTIFSTYDDCNSYAISKGAYRGSNSSDVCRKYKMNDKTNDCVEFKIDKEKSDKEAVKLQFTCNYYEKSIENLKTLTTEYSDCRKNGGSCSNEATNHDTELNKLKDYCKNVIAHENYSDTCMMKCLFDFKNDIKDISIDDTEVTIKCSLTEDIISMIYNILKWIKYILPALIIILTMLDFIKAIAAQNDDDMKKAQGKFIKRLIVAALLFLLPLIINFVLQTFGFYNSGCDITDLL